MVKPTSSALGASEPFRAAMGLLAALGAASALLYALVAFGLRFSNAAPDVTGFLGIFGVLFLLYGAAVLLVRGRRRRDPDPSRAARSLAVIFAFAVLFRALLLFAGLPAEKPLAALGRDLAGRSTGFEPFLIYDNDVWRYLWEGHVGAHGVSPYAVSPGRLAELAERGDQPFADVLADDLWWDVLDNVSFHAHTTVYPPFAQALFRWAHGFAPGSVFLWKLLVVAADLGTCWALLLLLRAVGRPDSEVILWAWNPLAVKELAGSGHVDAWMILPLTLGVVWLVQRAELRALAAWGASLLVKLGSAPLVVLFLRHTRPRSWVVLAAVGVMGWLPIAGEWREAWRGLAVYGGDWEFNSGPWALLRYLARLAGADRPELWAHGLTRAAILAAMVVVPWRSSGSPRSIVRSAFFLTALVTLLHPAVMPWYLLWSLPLAAAAGCASWAVLTGASLLSYLYYIDGLERPLWLVLEYAAFAVALAIERGWRMPRAIGSRI